MAIIEFPKRNNKRRFQLMVTRNNLNRYPLIVNYCPNHRCPEFDFETPSF